MSWLRPLTLAGAQVTRRLGVHDQRGRRPVHSPDLDSDRKLAVVQDLRAWVAEAPRRLVLLYEDELTDSRRPTIAQGDARVGSDEPHARQGLRSNWSQRLAASLDVTSGRRFGWPRQHFDRGTLIRYGRALETEDPEADILLVALDHGPVHWPEDVLNALATTKIVLVPWPTYAPWTNPVEKAGVGGRASFDCRAV